MSEKITWLFDYEHTEIGFKVRHMVITTVSGRFTQFDGKVITSADDFSNAEIEFSADVSSITTNLQDRDKHLKSSDFFDAANYPKLTFKSKSMTKSGPNNYKLTGDITIRGVTRELVLDVEFNGKTKDPFTGNEKAGFDLTGKLNRKEFGLHWNVLTEAGGAVAGDEVKLQLTVELLKQKD